MKRLLPAALLVVLTLLFSGCYTVPETGRQSLIVIPVGEETQLGASAFAEMKSKEKISADPQDNAQVTRVGKRIAEAVGDALPTAQWEFVVFDAPKTVNAFALPGGKVGVYSGLLKLCSSDDELAIVMGHEIGHVTARHGAERMTEGIFAAAGALVVDAATQSKTSNTRTAWLAGYGLFAAGTTLAFSRSHESEADHIGIRYAAKAGYDPRAAISFWRKMAAQKLGAKMPEFLSTHPSDDTRIDRLQGWMPEVMPLYEAARLRYQ
jgi:metalloendopeptidase OMA1, mitochondrial